jgi:hypothetical protein
MTAVPAPRERTGSPARERVLVVGRSPGVLEDAVAILASRGYRAEATNVFDRVLNEYDVSRLDVVVFGGMVPPDTKRQLRDEIARRNPGARFVQGLAGIPGVIAAQVEAVAAGEPPVAEQLTYDEATRSFLIELAAQAEVVVDAFWATAFTPPEPTSAAMRVFAGNLPPGRHRIALPDEVPAQAAFASVSVAGRVAVLTVGAMPEAVTRMVPGRSSDRSLPPVRAVATHTGEPS